MTSPSQQPDEDGSGRQPGDQPSPEDSAAETSSEQPKPEQPVTSGEASEPEQPTEAGDVSTPEQQAEAEDTSVPEQPAASEGTSPQEQPAKTGSASEQEQPAEAGSASEQERPAEPGDLPAAKKKRTGLVVGLVAAAVVILGGGAGLAYALTSGDSAREVADKYVAVSMKETQHPASVTAEDYRPLVCGKSMPQIEQVQKQKERMLKTAKPQQLEAMRQVKNTVKDVRENGETGKVTMETTLPGYPPQTSQLNLVKEDGDWQLCG